MNKVIVNTPKDIPILFWKTKDEERVSVELNGKSYSLMIDDCGGIFVEVYSMVENHKTKEMEIDAQIKRIYIDERS